MPFLSEKCGECHGKDTKAKGGLKLDDPKHLSRVDSKKTAWSFPVTGTPACSSSPCSDRPITRMRCLPREKAPGLPRRRPAWCNSGSQTEPRSNGKSGDKGPMPKEGEAGYIAVAEAAPPPKPRIAPKEQDWTNTRGENDSGHSGPGRWRQRCVLRMKNAARSTNTRSRNCQRAKQERNFPSNDTPSQPFPSFFPFCSPSSAMPCVDC